MKLIAFNLSSGGVEIHKAGCADIKRNVRKNQARRQDQVEFGQTDWATKYDFCHDYWDNGILEESEADLGVGTFDVFQEMEFAPCCDALPEGGPEAAPVKIGRREATQDLARRLVMAAATVFDGADGSEAWSAGLTRQEAEQKIADWLHSLPTGGAGAGRWWPEDLTRPSQADWQK